VTKLNISMPQELLDEIDAEADELGLTRSGLIQEAAARYIAGARGDREAERKRLRVESAANRMRAIGERCGLTGDAAQIVAETRAAEDSRHE
jgi:metal-responsive CopG/Arc/MetJ family transcriptional regulator